MMISQVQVGSHHIKGTADSGTEKNATRSVAGPKETEAGRSREDVFIRAETNKKTAIADYRSMKRLSGNQIKSLKNQCVESMKQLVTEMLGKQKAKAKMAISLDFEEFSSAADNAQNDWMSQFLNPQDTPETAAQAISKDGAWGVNAVATRLLDMAVSLSGGDVSKIDELRSAVEAGFKAAGDILGSELPGVCQDTYTETMNRFDYWTQHGSMDGYVMQD
ncbi:hypothetical protein ACS3UN_05040 [Oscillospiraceae bacterium LTW-04]|nr:hypothetical protein RBH76_05325 [Oscillospiraceae bacterium MB24-C1]